MKKVLIITYYWPPAGGPGVQRWLKFVKYLPEFGIEPIVYAPENPSYPIEDQNLENEVPAGVRVLKQPIREPYSWASFLSKKKTKRISSGLISEQKISFTEKLLLWIRGNFFIPDARKLWVKPSVAYLSELIEEEGLDTVITTGPPHSIHLIGLALKEKHHIDWIADFRDPWTSIGYHKNLRLTTKSERKHKLLEKTVLNTADKIIVTSSTTRKEFASITESPIRTITNGFDDMTRIETLDSKFTISHIGSLLTGRNPKNLWQVLQELVDADSTFSSQLCIQLIGVVGVEVLDSLEHFGLMPFVDKMEYMPHEKVLEIQQRSQVLLLLEIDSFETKGIIPGKLFEYFNAARPILAIGPKDWEAGAMVRDTNSGEVFEHRDLENIKTVLLDWFSKYQNHTLANNPEHIQGYHRRVLTESLANYIQWESSSSSH